MACQRCGGTECEDVTDFAGRVCANLCPECTTELTAKIIALPEYIRWSIASLMSSWSKETWSSAPMEEAEKIAQKWAKEFVDSEVELNKEVLQIVYPK